MKLISYFIILLFLASCDSDESEQILHKRLNEIKKFQEFDNTPVIYSDSFRIKIFSSPYQDYNPYHPYQFLRDTAQTEDLIKLLNDDNPFVRTYVFAALSKRKLDLFPILIEHLSDTTTFYTSEDDYGYLSSPADMMLQYISNELTIHQKDSIANLILSKYHNLKTTKEILLFHKPTPEHYKYIKEIAKSGHQEKFALVALSRYQKTDDLELIKAGFRMTDYYSGYKVFFMAIEEFNHQDFKDELIKYKSSINKGFDNQGHDYYFNALAKYHDPECLNVIAEFVNVENYRMEVYKMNNLRMLWRALKKYNFTEYQPLIKKIETRFSNKEDLEHDDNHLLRNPWNY